LSYFISFDGILWLLLTAAALIILQSILHREIQAFFLILTRKPSVTQIIFALIFFPGVFLHESSHYITAKIAGVQTGKISLIPQSQADGRLRLGYVEIASGGFLRDALIGAAPLVTGSLLVAYIAIYPMHLIPLWDVLRTAEWNAFWTMLASIPDYPDFWLWFYLAFTVSSTMMPSKSDRHAWLPLGILMAGLVGVAILAGAGNWMLVKVAPPFNQFLRALAMVFGLSGILHVVLILPMLLLHWISARVSGVDVE
jgi:hypothetical protein